MGKTSIRYCKKALKTNVLIYGASYKRMAAAYRYNQSKMAVIAWINSLNSNQLIHK